MNETKGIVSKESNILYSYDGTFLYLYDEDNDISNCIVPNDRFFDILERVVNRDYGRMARVIDEGEPVTYMTRDFLLDNSPDSLLIFLYVNNEVLFELNCFGEPDLDDIWMEIDELEDFYHKLKRHYDAVKNTKQD